MNISYYVKIFLASLVAFFVIDMLWLGVLARGYYRKHLGFVMRASPNWTAALIFYLLFVGGLVFFAIAPGLEANSLGRALMLGAMYGLVTYGTYDLTNLATLKDWPTTLVIVDILWGIVLSSTVTWAGFLVGGWLK
jgi:uncharacterized membrane protein